MIRLLSSATGTSTSTNDATPSAEGGENKSRLRMGLDWFQSQLLSADGMALPTFERRRHRRASQWTGSDTGIHRVRINLDKNTTQYVIGLGEYSDKEYHDTFFDSTDLKQIFEQAYKIVEKLQAGEVDTKICTRGLDKLYGERQEACRTIRSKSINAVMDLQEEQWNNDADDFEELAKLCREITKEAKRRAVSEARQDTRAAQSYLRDVDKSQWDNTTTSTKTKSILKLRTSAVGLPIGQPLFPDVRNQNASFHDLRRSPFENCATTIGRETTREARRGLPSSPNTPMQRSKERLTKQPSSHTSQSRRHAIAESMDNANGLLADSNHSQASFAMDDDHAQQRTRGIRRSSSAGALAMKPNLLHQNRNTTRSVNCNDNDEEGKGKITKDLERKRVPPNRSVSSGENNLSTMTPSSHRRRIAIPKVEPATGSETPTVKKRAPPSRSKSDVTAGLGLLSTPLLQQRRPIPSVSNEDSKVEAKRETKTRAPPQKSKSNLVAGAKISRFARPAPIGDEKEPESAVTESTPKSSRKKHSPRSNSEHSRKIDSSEDILSLDGNSMDAKMAKKKHLSRRTPSDLHRRGAGGTEDDNSMAKIKIKLNKEITQNSLPSRRLSADRGVIKGTSPGSSDIPPESHRAVQKKVPLAKSVSEHGPRKNLSDHGLRKNTSDHNRVTSETERTTKGRSTPKRTSSGQSVSEDHRKDVSSSDDDEIFSLDGSHKEEKLVKKKALPRRSISDLNGSKHLSIDNGEMPEITKPMKGTEVKKRMSPQRSASAMPAPGGKSSNATRTPPRERPE